MQQYKFESSFSFTGRIVPHEGKDIDAWTDINGFDPHSLICNKFDEEITERPTYNDIATATGKWLAAFGKEIAFCFIQRDTNDNGKELPYGSNLNFSVCPPCYQPNAFLMRWLNVQDRGYQLCPQYNLLQVVNEMRNQTEPIEV